MRFSEELEFYLLIERKIHEIDKDWIKGVRKGWQVLFKQRKNYPGRIVKSKYKIVDPKRDHKITQEAVKSARLYLRKVNSFLELLQRDLMINKGLWPPPKGGEIGISKLLKMKKAEMDDFAIKLKQGKGKSGVVRSLDRAKKVINYPREHEYGHNDYVARMYQGHPAFAFSDVDGMNGVLLTVANHVEEDVDKVNRILNRSLWKALEKFIDEFGAGKGTDEKNPVTFGGFVPDELKLGKVTVRFQDAPSRRPGDEGLGYVHPEQRAPYVGELKKAWELLKKRNLGHLWYGSITIWPPSDAPRVKDAKGRKMTAGAHYIPWEDRVEVFANRDYSTIIHELGHRQYYKFMSRRDRGAFSQFFGEIKATSEYGSTRPREDFAEIFTEYVFGKMNLTPDQIARFEDAIGVGNRPRVDVPKVGATKSVVGGLYGRHDKEPPRVAFVGFDKVDWGDWGVLFDALRDIDRGNYAPVKKMFRRGITIQNVSSPDGLVVADPDGVLVFNLTDPKSLGRGAAGEARLLDKIGRVYYNSRFVTSEMRDSWSNIWFYRLKEGQNDAEVRYGKFFRKMVAGFPINDDQVMEYMYWTFGMLVKPEWVKDHPSTKDKSGKYQVPTPRQMHQRTGMRLPGMESQQQGGLSKLLECAVSETRE